MEERINKMKNDMETLKAWKDANNKQQFSNGSFGPVTRNIVQKDRMVLSKKTFTESGQFDTAIEVTLNGLDLFIIASVGATSSGSPAPL